MPQKVKKVLEELSNFFQEVLGRNLVGIYLHGSLAMGCFNPASSDIDIIAVIKGKLSLQAKNKLQAGIRLSSKKYPQNEFEISVVKQDVLRKFKYPTPFEFHFSKSSKNVSAKNNTGYDNDLVAHFAMVKKRGLCLYGKPIRSIFPNIPKKYFLKSIAQDAKWSAENVRKAKEKGKCPVPTYAVLNFCRAIAFIRSNEFFSKKEGGEWGLKHLPKKYAPIIKEALKKYRKRNSAKTVDSELLKQFSEYSWNVIKKYY